MSPNETRLLPAPSAPVPARFAGPVLAIAQALELLVQLDAPGAAAASSSELYALYTTVLPSLDPLHARFYGGEVARLSLKAAPLC